MSFLRACTRRRVTVAMASLLIVVFGTISLSELPVNLLPELAYPKLTVRTGFTGAAPQEIETLITRPIEEQLGVVEGVQELRSVSRTGQSDVILSFAWGTDMDLAGLHVREKLELLELPLAAERPVLLRFDPSTDPILRVAFFDERAGERFDEASLTAVRRFAEEALKKRLEPIEGVAAVKLSGGLEDEIQIAVDPRRLAQFGLSAGDVVARLRDENVNVSGGRLEEGAARYLVRTVNEFESVEGFGDLILALNDRRAIHLRDVATISRGYKERQAIIRTNGREAVEIAIYKEGDANTVRVAGAVRAELGELEERLPGGMRLLLVDDQSRFIRRAIAEVRDAALLGGLLAILVLYLFLRDAWATAIISASIPLSVIATFFLMDQASLSLNIMSLGGIALAIGLLVDNAIVVLENISRHRERGAGVIDAAVEGAGEVGGAVLAATLTTIAVFLPLVFVQGVGGQLFSDQALTVTFALAASLAVALTVIPMLSSLKVRSPVAFPDEAHRDRPPRTRMGGRVRRARRTALNTGPELALAGLLGAGRRLGRWTAFLLRPAARGVGGGFERLRAAYGRFLPAALRHRSLVLALALGALALAGALVPRLGGELIPQLAQGRFEMQLELPPGSPLEATDAAIGRVQAAAREEPVIADVFAVSGTGNRIDANPTETGENIGDLLVVLSDPGEAAEAAAMEVLRAAVARIPGASADFSRPALFSFATPLTIEVLGYELDALAATAGAIAAGLAGEPRFADVRSSLAAGHPELRIRFDQERAAALGLTVRDIADEVVRQLRGEVATRYSWRDRRIDVRVRAVEADRSSLAAVENLIVNPRSERPVVLSAVAEIVATEGPAEIHRVDQERAAVVTANLRFGTLKEATAAARALLAEVRTPFGVSVRIAGQSEEMDASFRSLLFALGLAIFLVYLVMASQFESLVHPFVILFSVPLALVGAVLALFLTSTPVSVIVFIGLIMLAGIVVNNAIVLVDLVNQLRARGLARREAIVEGARSRLRPILMTTLTTTLGLLPLALGFGEGAELRAPLAITVIGGLLVSTLLTLVVVPVLYDLFDRGRRATAAPARGAEIGP